MLTKTAFNELLKQARVLIIDGGLATELEKRGHDLSHPLWSGKVLSQNPEAIEQVHLDYFLAGADIVITSTYQTSTRGLNEHLQLSDVEAKNLIKKSVQLAKSARTKAYERGVPEKRTLLVAGSVGPYGAYLADGSEYRGRYGLSVAELEAFHRPRIQALLEADVDLLAFETIPDVHEAEALQNLVQHEFPTAIAMLSCSLYDPRQISSGVMMDVVVEKLRYSSRIVAFGANCVPPDMITMFLEYAYPKMPLLCYPNSGEVYDGSSKTWSGNVSHSDLATLAINEWIPAGAQLIGGCCRTTPDDIRALRAAIDAGDFTKKTYRDAA